MVRTRQATGALVAPQYTDDRSDAEDEVLPVKKRARVSKKKSNITTDPVTDPALPGLKQWKSTTKLASGGKLTESAQVSLPMKPASFLITNWCSTTSWPRSLRRWWKSSIMILSR